MGTDDGDSEIEEVVEKAKKGTFEKLELLY
jgi:hypothetical protein